MLIIQTLSLLIIFSRDYYNNHIDNFRYLLREPSVPPYFRNVLGGAVWWEIMHAADDAVSNAEGLCACEELINGEQPSIINSD